MPPGPRYYSGMEHISDFDLERWHLGMIDDEDERGRIEAHVISCQDCLLRAMEAQRYVDAMRAAIVTGDFDLEWIRRNSSG